MHGCHKMHVDMCRSNKWSYRIKWLKFKVYFFLSFRLRRYIRKAFYLQLHLKYQKFENFKTLKLQRLKKKKFLNAGNNKDPGTNAFNYTYSQKTLKIISRSAFKGVIGAAKITTFFVALKMVNHITEKITRCVFNQFFNNKHMLFSALAI